MTNEEVIRIMQTEQAYANERYATDTCRYHRVDKAYNMAIESLENQKIGHWIWENRVITETYTDPEEIEYIGWVCDNCYNPPNNYAEWDNPEEKPMYKYCPNCGAKMEGVEQ